MQHTEATGSNPVEAPKTFFGLFCNYLNCDTLRWSHIHFRYDHSQNKFKLNAFRLAANELFFFPNEKVCN